ncbi:protein kinase activating protein dpb11 [Dermatophagoides farinae]|uniref:Protein kinase activating protein dpb11 n=1 Tax=Dermatophagoides farinae TaxID=6954 RepID=A0A922HT36_DERFA|nr:protein kinase activating protein dpb11 [Dermatophagoides farinae]
MNHSLLVNIRASMLRLFTNKRVPLSKPLCGSILRLNMIIDPMFNPIEDEVDIENDDVEEYECDHNMCSLIQGENEEQNLEMNAPIPTIMFSGFEREEKLRLSKLCNEKIPKIIIKDDSIVTSELTHLILVEPCGTEKVYAAIVAGAFILKPNYIEDSIKTNTLLNEKEYQWGNGIDDEKIDKTIYVSWT